MKNTIFEDLFVLEMSNNHLGDLERGKKIIADFSKVAKLNGIKAAIKLQLRDSETFVHKDFRNRDDIKYIKKALRTKMLFDDYKILVEEIKKSGCIAMATPFDEASVDMCLDLEIEIIKIASCDITDKILIEKIIAAKKPVIISTGAAYLEDIDNSVNLFEEKNIPLAINHCVSIYPCEKSELELNQIDFLKNRYPNHVIGFSTHEYNDDIELSMLIAYAKGARTFERHIDLDFEGKKPCKHCSTPSDLDRWIKAYKKAQKICGSSSTKKKIPSQKELDYIESQTRGVYAKRNLRIGEKVTEKDIYLAIPLQKGQLSCKEFFQGEILINRVNKDAPVMTDDINSSVVKNQSPQNSSSQIPV